MKSPEGSARGIDKTRIATFGYSAGAHLATLVTAVADDPKWGQKTDVVQAVVAGGTPTDLVAFKDGDLVPNFIGHTYAEAAQAYQDASPIYHISRDDPPVFLYHAGFDQLVPLDQATRYKEALDQAGVANELFVIRGHGHFSGFLFDHAAIRAALNFLDRHLRHPSQASHSLSSTMP